KAKQASTVGNHLRKTLAKSLQKAELRVNNELAGIAKKRSDAEAREALREEGEAIFATLHELDEASREEAKERATKIFAQYRKLGASLPHLDEREQHL